jgi:hypothetical protein
VGLTPGHAEPSLFGKPILAPIRPLVTVNGMFGFVHGQGVL